jgi:MFS family permease
MDKIFETVGLEGTYQKILFIINLFTGSLPCIYSFQVPFLTKFPSFFVQKLKSDDPNKIYELEFSKELCDSTLYKIVKNPSKSIINWTYTYDLFCEKETYVTTITSIIFIGNMLGTLFIGPWIDNYGRSKILKISVSISLILHLNLLFCIGPFHLVIINFIGGFFFSIYSVGYALFTEFFLKSKNGILIGIYNAIYPLSGILFTFFFMVSYSWRLLYLITSIIHFYYVYLVFKYFLESPRWLHSVGNKEGCLETLTQLAILNGRQEQWIDFQNKNKDIINKIGTPFLEKAEGNDANNDKLKKNYNILQILQFKSQRTIFIKLTIISTFCSYNYYGIILNLGKMKGNFYLNSIFAFLGEFICELISGKLADKYGRIFIMLCSCLLGVTGYILYMMSPFLKFLFVFIAMIGFAGIFNVLTIYMPEIYPTKIRNITYSYTSFISRISPIIIPILSQNFPKLIDYSFILSGVINGLLGMTLEETLGKKLLDIIPEEEEQNENLKLKFLKE